MKHSTASSPKVRIARSEVVVPYQSPLDWEHLLSFLRGHQIEGMERIENGAYERPVRFDGRTGWIRVTHDAAKQHLHVELLGGDRKWLPAIATRVRRMFDLDADMAIIEALMLSHTVLGSLWKKTPGLRISRGWDPYETAITTILGQLVSVKQARALAGQLLANHGEPMMHPVTGETVYLFPEAKALATADLAAVRTSGARKKSIREMARAIAEGELDLHDRTDFPTLKKQLLSMPGIGPWSAEYIALRALGDPDAMPQTDLVLKRVIQALVDFDLEAFRPWRGYAAIYLWKHSAQFKPSEGEVHDVRVKKDKVSGGRTDAGGKRSRTGGRAVAKRQAGKSAAQRRRSK